MKRLIIAAIIFCLTVGFCITGFLVVTAKGEQMIDVISEYSREIQDNPDAELTKIAEKINKEWSIHSTLFKSVFIHNDFSEIEILLKKLITLANQDSPELFVECCDEVIYRLHYTLSNEKPKLRNIF